MMTFASKLRRKIRLAYRQKRRRAILRVRKLFQLDEDVLRDHLILGLERDRELAGKALIALSQKNAQLAAALKRLAFYEERIPRMRALKAEFDAELARQQAEEKDRSDACERGVLTLRDRIKQRATRMRAENAPTAMTAG